MLAAWPAGPARRPAGEFSARLHPLGDGHPEQVKAPSQHVEGEHAEGQPATPELRAVASASVPDAHLAATIWTLTATAMALPSVITCLTWLGSRWRVRERRVVVTCGFPAFCKRTAH